MKVTKIYEIEGFDKNLFKKGQVIKVKRHLSEREKENPTHRGRNLETLYFVKDIDIKKLTLTDNIGKEHTLTLSELTPDPDFDNYGYYEIIEIYELNNPKFDSGIKFL